MIKAILFDIDNTLFPSSEFAELARKNAINAMVAAGLNADPDKAYSKLLQIIKKYGPNYPKHFNILLRELGVKPNPKIIAAGVVAYHQTKSSIFPFPDVPKTILQLREHYTLCVASEGKAIKQWDKLIRLGLHNFFHHVFVTPKKTKNFYSSIIKKLKIQPNEAVMVGDSVEKDIKPAKEAGITTILLSHQKDKHADYTITAIKELLPILQELRE